MGLHTYAALAGTIMRRPPRLGPVRLVAVDGRAGSGKTTFARRLSIALRARGVQVAEVHTDDLLEGWADIVSFWPRLEEWILDPLRHGRDAAYRGYDWHTSRFRTEWTMVEVPDTLVLEGVTTARAAVRAELSLGVFMVADRELRLARGIARDGEALRPQWLRWMADEDAHFALDRTSDHVDVLVDGAPTVVHDPETEFLSAARR
jgi:uridine kinase